LENEFREDYKGSYIRLIDGKSEVEKERMFREAVKKTLPLR